MAERLISTDMQVLERLSRITALVSELRQDIIDRGNIDWKEAAKVDKILAIQVLAKQQRMPLIEAKRIVEEHNALR